MCCARARVAVPAGMWPRPRQPSDSAPSGGPSRAASEWSHPSPGRIDHHPPAAIGRPRLRHIAHRPLHTSSVPLSPARITCHHTRPHRSHHHRRTHCPPFAVALFIAISCLVCPIAASVFSSLHYAIAPSSSSSSSSSSGTAASSADSASNSSPGRHGPRFLVEPPPKVHFLNDSGTVVTCKVAGAPPVRIWWSLSDGTAVTDVHGLRHVRPNGDLVISPHGASNYRQDVHATIYRCMATNAIGTIRSRDSEIRSVIQQPYSVQVYGEYAIAGNTGHMKCQIPAFVRDYVKVTAWLKGDAIVATSLSPKDSRFVILSNGDLLIRNTSRHDSGYYRCQTRHELSQETVLSSIEGHFIVNDVYSGVSPRISSQSPVRAQLGKSAELVCVTKAWPQPSVRWFQATETGLITPVRPSANVQVFDSVLAISHVSEQHAGNWICVANNSLGEERAYIELYVLRPPVVRLVPDFLVADMSSSATFVCNVTQGSALSILWVKDGQPIISASAAGSGAGMGTSVTAIGYASGEGRIRLIEPHILNIRNVVREDAGCYQCVVQSEDETSQASGELKLGDSPPIFTETFKEGLIYEEGSTISLRCSATATPLPQIRWFLDDFPLDGYAPRRLSMADYVKHGGHVVSFVNITNAKVLDGGEYRCLASNNAGHVSFSSRINVIGSAALRTPWSSAAGGASSSSDSKNDPTLPCTMTVVSGRSVVIRCPVIAYPIESLVWQHRATTLPNNHRQKVDAIIGGVGGKLFIANVHRDNDQGEYSCTVKGSDGKSVRGTVQMVVRVAPLIDSQLIAAQTVANQGMKVKLMCSVLEGDPPVRIKWFHDGSKTPVVSNHQLGISVQEDDDYSLLTFRSVAIRDMGNWTCRAWNDVESVNRTTFLVVNVAPSWRVEPKNVYVVLGRSVVVDCSAEGHPQPRILWKKSVNNGPTGSGAGADDLEADNNLVIDANGAVNSAAPVNHPSEYRELLSTYRRQVYPNGTLWIQEVEKADAGFFMCQISNGIGAGLSKVIQLIVQSPPFFATKFLSKSVSKGELALLECEAQGDPVLHIRWFKDRALILPNPLSHPEENATVTNGTLASSASTPLYDKRYTIKQDVISSQKVISYLQIVSVQREDSTIYTCLARNSHGFDNTSVQLIVQEVPDPPQSVELVEVTSRTAQFQWKSPYSGNSALTRFYIHYRLLNCTAQLLDARKDSSGSTYWKEVSTQSGNELRFLLKGLTPNCYYECKMSSENQIGRSEHSSAVITVKTAEEVPGGPPLDVQVETTSSTSLKIKWRPPSREVQFGRIRGYYIGYKVAGTDETFQYKNVDVVNDDYQQQQSQSQDSYQVSYITNLKRKTTYLVILQAYNNIGPGPRSDEIQISTFDSQPPTSPLLEVVSTTYDGILIKWDSSFQDSSTGNGEIDEEKEYVLYFREDAHHGHGGHQPSSQPEWHQKRIYATKTNQFVLSKDNSQARIRCGTKYHLYMTATNSLGTGEPSETVIARTKGDPPIAPAKSDFIKLNSTTAVLALKAWQPRGCPITAFSIQYKPIHQKQWIPLAEHLEMDSRTRDFFYVNHLSPNRDYQLLVGAHSDPGVTRQEYSFHTPNTSSAVIRMIASPQDPYTRIGLDSGPPASASLFRNLTVLLPVMISLLVLIVILGTLFGCMRRQHVNHVVNGSADQHGDGLCPEHLGGCLHNGKEAIMMDRGRRGSECYPLNEFRTPVPGNANQSNCASLNNSSCDSKSNLLNGTVNGEHLANTGTSPRHMLHSSSNFADQNAQAAANHFATLNCKKMKLLQDQQTGSYYSSPQRKLLMSGLASGARMGNSGPNSEHHEYAEPLQAILNRAARCSVDLLLDETGLSSGANGEANNHCQLVGGDSSTGALLALNSGPQGPTQQVPMPTKVQLQPDKAYATINKKNMSSMPYL